MPREADPELNHAEVAGWVLGILDPGEAAEFEAHLVGCAECQTVVAEFESVAEALNGPIVPAVEPPADLEAKTMASVQYAVFAARQAKEGITARAPGRMSRWWHWHQSFRVFSVAAVCGAAAATIVVSSHSSWARPRPGSWRRST